MGNNKRKFSKIIKTIFKFGVLCAYVALILVLVLQALKPGNESSDVSNNVGDKIDQVVTEIQKPEVTQIKVESVRITSLTASGLKFEGEEISLSLGTVATVKSEVLPNNATNPTLNFTSSNPDVIEAYPDGKVKALSLGRATLTVSAQENADLTSSVLINVIDLPIEGICIGNIPSNNEIQVGQSVRLEATYQPVNTSQREVKWESSDISVLTVSSSGVIKGIKTGEATVTLTSTANETLTQTVTLTVIPKIIIPDEPEIPVTEINLTAESLVGYVGKTVQLSYSLSPSGAKDGVLWKSADESVATVSQKGLVTFLKAGTVTIKAKCSMYDVKSEITFTVKEVLSDSITLSFENFISKGENTYEIKQGNSGKVSAVLSEDATILTVKYSSSDPEIAKIGADGVVEAIKGGTVTITATTSDGEKTTQERFTLVVNPITFSDTMQNFYFWVRKSFGHFGAFLVLGIFAAFTYYCFCSKSLKGKIVGFIVCIVAGFAVAGITEILQLPIFTSGRYCSFSDVMLDFKGYLSSSLVIYFIIFATHFIKLFAARRKMKKSESK